MEAQGKGHRALARLCPTRSSEELEVKFDLMLTIQS